MCVSSYPYLYCLNSYPDHRTAFEKVRTQYTAAALGPDDEHWTLTAESALRAAQDAGRRTQDARRAMPQVPGRPQRLRPKHAQLILKCYPRLPKNSAADVKPNSSELSYLLYYASTRQHKLPKVGHFLETRTASDVYHWQSAAVHVTLRILTAILEHNTINRASGFALIAPFVSLIAMASHDSWPRPSGADSRLRYCAFSARSSTRPTISA